MCVNEDKWNKRVSKVCHATQKQHIGNIPPFSFAASVMNHKQNTSTRTHTCARTHTRCDQPEKSMPMQVVPARSTAGASLDLCNITSSVWAVTCTAGAGKRNTGVGWEEVGIYQREVAAPWPPMSCICPGVRTYTGDRRSTCSRLLPANRHFSEGVFGWGEE